MSINQSEFGKCVKRHREAMNMTQQTLADMLGVQVKSVSYIERGMNYPSTERLFRLAQILDISLDEFVYGASRLDLQLNIAGLNAVLDRVQDKYKPLLLSVLSSAATEINKLG